MIEWFDFDRSYTAYEVHNLFRDCIWCNKRCKEELVDELVSWLITWFKCRDCGFSVRFARIGGDGHIDFFFELDSQRWIQVVAGRTVELFERNKVLKVMSRDPVPNLKELKELVNKYAVLI